MKRILLVLCVVILSCCLIGSTKGSNRIIYKFTELPGMRAVAINDRGTVILQNGNGAGVWIPKYSNGSKGKYVDLGYMQPVRRDTEYGVVTRIYDINNRGEIVGVSGSANTARGFGDTRSFKIKAGQTLQRSNQIAGGNLPFPLAISNKGVIVGGHRTVDSSYAIKWLGNWKYLSLGSLIPGDFDCAACDINDKGTIIGNSGEQAWIYSNKRIKGIGEGKACAINNRNIIVGMHKSRACNWINGKPVFLDKEQIVKRERTGGLTQSRATSINDRNQRVGYIMTYARNPQDKRFYSYEHAVMWQNGRRINLQSLVKLPKGWKRLAVAQAINNKGQIVGYGERVTPTNSGQSSDERAFLLTPVRR